MKVAALFLALVATGAFAQAPLISTLDPAQVPAAEQARAAKMRADPKVLSVTHVRLDANALYSNVVSLAIDGRTYVFTGKSTVTHKDGTGGWFGTSTEGASLNLGYHDGLIGGQVDGIPHPRGINGKPPYGLLIERARDQTSWTHGTSPLPAFPASGPAGPIRVNPVPTIPASGVPR